MKYLTLFGMGGKITPQANFRAKRENDTGRRPVTFFHGIEFSFTHFLKIWGHLVGQKTLCGGSTEIKVSKYRVHAGETHFVT